MAYVVRQWSGREARALREAKRMTVRGFAAHIGVSERTISKWDAAQDDIEPRPEMQAALDTALAIASVEEAARFRQIVNAASFRRARPEFTVRMYRFVSTYVGAEAAEAMLGRRGLVATPPRWLGCRGRRLGRGPSRGRLYVFGFGVAIVQVSTQIESDRLGEVAACQITHAAEDRDWAIDQLTAELSVAGHKADGDVVAGPPLYWVDRAGLPDRARADALRLLCTPGLLVDRDHRLGPQPISAEAEQYWLAVGIDHLDLHSFGLRGVSVGFASWAANAYLPVARPDALALEDLIGLDLSVRALACYGRWLTAEHHAGRELPTDEYGAAWLRAALGTLNGHGRTDVQHRLAREALMKSTGLAGQLHDTIRLFGLPPGPEPA